MTICKASFCLNSMTKVTNHDNHAAGVLWHGGTADCCVQPSRHLNTSRRVLDTNTGATLKLVATTMKVDL